MSSDPSSQPGGFNPLPPLGSPPGPSIEDEERAMHAGRGRMLAFAALVVAALVGLVAFFMMHGGPNEYGQVGRQVNGLKAQNFDSFWACALPRMDLHDLRNDQQLRSAIHERAAFNPSQYAQLVRGTCLANLADHVQPLDALMPPEDLRPGVDALRAAVRALLESWDAYLAYLQGLADHYDAESDQASTLVGAVARAWFEYRTAFAQVNEIVRAHL